MHKKRGARLNNLPQPRPKTLRHRSAIRSTTKCWYRYIYINIYVYEKRERRGERERDIYIYIYIYIWREREMQRGNYLFI